jgi:GntR family transcriptional regulator, transcriptional repressor for pyruvate dehydrogenase complex
MAFILEPALVRGGDARTLKTADRVAREIVDLIVEADLPEGARLPNERDMGDAFGISRGTLREALRLLESWGIVTVRAGRDGGPIVRYPRSEALAEGMAAVLRLRRVDVSDLLVARRAIEPELARLAAAHVTQTHIDAMAETVEVMKAATCELEEYLDANARFHMLVAEAAGSTPLQIFSESLKTIADGSLAGLSIGEARRHTVVTAHVRVVSALETREPDLAADAMRDHLTDAIGYWRSHHPTEFSSPVNWIRPRSERTATIRKLPDDTMGDPR